MANHPDIPGVKLDQLAIAARGRPVAVLIRSAGDFEARTLDGADMGHGPNLLLALEDLLAELTGTRFESRVAASRCGADSMMRNNRGLL